MIKVENTEIKINRFPDGTLLLNPPEIDEECYWINAATITWNFESNEEMAALMFLTRHLKDNGIFYVHLVMPYIPNARMDRVKHRQDGIKRDKDVFTLKYFAEFINNLEFLTVTVLDPHSPVSEALFNNIIVKTPKKYIQKAISKVYEETNNKEIISFYPDEGSMKRYSGLISMPYTFGIKNRDWETGKINGLSVVGDTFLIKGRNVLIIDDICSRGGTFYHSAKKLKELGANKIYLYVTHCENTILDGELLNSGLIEKVFTTNSLFTKEHEKIEVMNI